MSTKVTRSQQGYEKDCKGTLRVRLHDSQGSQQPIQGVHVSIYELRPQSKEWQLVDGPRVSDRNGCAEFELPGGESHTYRVSFECALGFSKPPDSCPDSVVIAEENETFKIECDCTKQIDVGVLADLSHEILTAAPGCTFISCEDIVVGQSSMIRVSYHAALKNLGVKVATSGGTLSRPRIYVDKDRKVHEYNLDTRHMEPGPYTISAQAKHSDGSQIETGSEGLTRRNVQDVEARTTTSLTRTETEPTDDVALWVAIRNSTEALSFNNYLRFMDWIFCGKNDLTNLKDFERTRFKNGKLPEYLRLRDKRSLPFPDTEAYRVVKAATEAFVMVNCGVHGEHPPFTVDGDRDLDSEYLGRRDIPPPGSNLRDVFEANYLETVDATSTLPYLAIIRRKLPDIPIKTTLFEDADPSHGHADDCFGLLQEKLANPCLLELIWSYWHEEGMLVQTTNAISWRFQNRRSASPRDPLANLELDPLRPLNNLLWGYIQDEQHRLTVMRRNYEYDHHYGLRLEGQAVQQFNPADTRSKFLEAFHHLLRLCTVFYKQDDDTTVKADAFPVLNALKETHLVLSQGAHNQFGDLPSTARIEMLMQQWLLARPEFREVLPTRIMVAYPEPWMDRVDAMKRLQGWTDTSVLHFRNLGLFGEQILLAIRWGHWSDVQEPVQAFNWVRFFRPQVQGYIHAYRAVTGVDLAAETVDTKADATMPSVLLKRRLALQQRAS